MGKSEGKIANCSSTTPPPDISHPQPAMLALALHCHPHTLPCLGQPPPYAAALMLVTRTSWCALPPPGSIYPLTHWTHTVLTTPTTSPACWPACEPLGTCNFLLFSPLKLVSGSQQKVVKRPLLNDLQSSFNNSRPRLTEFKVVPLKDLAPIMKEVNEVIAKIKITSIEQTISLPPVQQWGLQENWY